MTKPKTRPTVSPTQPAGGRGAAERTTPGRSTSRRSLVTSELLEKATVLFANQGYEATSLQDIADAVGVSRSALYNYVSNKEDLLTALVDSLSQGLADSLAALRQRRDLTPTEKLRELTGTLVRQRAEQPTQFRALDRSEMMLPEDVRARHLAARRGIVAELVAVIEEGMDGGEFKAMDSRVAALSLLGMCNWVAWWFRPGPGHEVEPIVTQISQSALDMLLAPHARRARGNSVAAALDQVRADLTALERLLPRT
ncbi:TetR/AcrR family transcriptional regulator [Streptomyces sp. NBC_01477]|uniref:TetR/AcrR family transcriptional regulator n=1 Tax=Streptomyces sp. NBC_01477 TaxID=2976015 RepID=UPI002E30E233|nr:TetR/AcrR family transcriptional regulator [Streptomyces sp. NBC_01477]